jgi:hypothetical protein
MAYGFGFWFGVEFFDDVFDFKVVGGLILGEGAL